MYGQGTSAVGGWRATMKPAEWRVGTELCSMGALGRAGVPCPRDGAPRAGAHRTVTCGPDRPMAVRPRAQTWVRELAPVTRRWAGSGARPKVAVLACAGPERPDGGPAAGGGSSTMRAAAQAHRRSAARRPRGRRLGLGGRGAPAQLLDAAQDPLHVAHLGHAQVLQREHGHRDARQSVPRTRRQAAHHEIGDGVSGGPPRDP